MSGIARLWVCDDDSKKLLMTFPLELIVYQGRQRGDV